jgi:hypothetical protein
MVSDAASHKPLYPVTVTNVATQQSVYSNDKGLYSISAHTGDVLAFSYIGYKTVERRVPPFVTIATINIVMEKTAYQLQEFQLLPGNLTPYQKDSLNRAVTYRVPLQRRPPSPFRSPVSALAEKFSKRAKRTYQFQKDFRQGEIDYFVGTRYTPELVTELTGLKGDSIGYFMYAYPMPYDFARAASDLEIKIWIRENFKEWNAPKH